MQLLIKRNAITCLLAFGLLGFSANAQTDADAIMMGKQNFCVGAMYSHGSWKDYWEGTLKRENLNLGTVSTSAFSVMGNYGITNKLNVIFSVPYISTKASAGTMQGDNGLQDLSAWLKWMPLEKKMGKSVFALYGVGGFSTPLTGYSGDYLPFSIGLHSTNLAGRLIADIQHGDFFATASGTYVYRGNVTINRYAYYTTEMHYTNEVEMPDVASFQFRTGYRTMRWIVEGIVDNSNTLGGFDIRRNDMPFPSNKMNWTSVGANIKYTFKKMPGLSLIGGGNYVVNGRNVGQSTQLYGGAFYILNFAKPLKDGAKPQHSCKLCIK